MVHAIDVVRWIAVGSPKAAATLIGQYNSPVPNSWNSIIKFDNDVTGIIKSNYQTGGRVHSFEIHGYTASAYINLGFAVPDCDARIIFHMGKQSYSAASAGTGSDEVVYYDGKKWPEAKSIINTTAIIMKSGSLSIVYAPVRIRKLICMIPFIPWNWLRCWQTVLFSSTELRHDPG